MSLLDHPPPSVPPPDPPSESLLAGFDAGTASDDELLDEIASIEAEQRRLDARRMAVFGETAARSVTERRHGLTLKAWLMHEHRLAPATAARQVATAAKLRMVLPEMAGALASGAVNFDHCALLARLCNPRVEQIVPELQAQFIELAGLERFEPWAHDVRGLISLADADGPGPLSPPKNRLRMTDGIDGELHIRAEFIGATAAQVRAAIREEAQRRYRAHVQANNQQTPCACEHADGECCDNESGHSCCEPLAGFDEFPGRNELYAEAAAELLARGCGARPNAPSPVTDVTLVVQASGPLDARTPDGVRIQDGTTRELMCDAVFHAVVVDQLGVPIDQGHAERLYTPEQRRNLKVRDGGCGHPGCDAPWEHCRIHHVDHWEHHGPTDQTNGLPACNRHHTLWHADGWAVLPDPDTHHLDQGFIIVTPDGDVLRSQRHGKVRPLITQMGLDQS